MILKIDKSGNISFPRKINLIDGNYKMNNCMLNRETICKDLGTDFQSTMNFNNHYTKIVNEAYKAL